MVLLVLADGISDHFTWQQSWQPGTQGMTFHHVPDFNSHYDFD